MKIGIIVAMDKELALLLPLMADVSEISVNGFAFHTGKLAGHDIVACKCGIGKVNAAVGALTLIENFHPMMIINTGVAGGTGATSEPARVLDVVLASEIAYHDVWCGPGTVKGEAAGCPARFTCPLPEDIRRQLSVKEGLLASGDIFVDNPDDLRRILDLYPDAKAVDMESAAIAQVCYIKNVPFVCIRVVSDTPGDGGNAAAYENFWQAAPERTFDEVEKLLGLL
ncbi:MAG: 5'-methylthioadenosine/adenosylhomocysteine nucleosidase [Muribaculaceae bacterium]|jgi:adenosylhomocysteine nucleosidase|nr:5'-methylthioadenosine/adenosylhomocysteine nucleosidase [Muribaculaceae bacterium]